jgi:NitT/TauT family transport system permease protein
MALASGSRQMKDKSIIVKSVVLPLTLVGILIVVWSVVWAAGVFHASAFPSPLAVVRSFEVEIRTGRLANDVIVSLFRVSCGFSIAVALLTSA